ncbi:hypothetical protein M0805_008459 [Coniferiporia weirii]|nr:hypothetical protein M0805_008459 [Coniferiporia weirii]
MSQSGNDSAADQKFLAIKGDLEQISPRKDICRNRALLIAIEIDFKGNRPLHKITVKVKSGEDDHWTRSFGKDGVLRWNFGEDIYPSLSVDLNITVQWTRTLPPGRHSSVVNIDLLEEVKKNASSIRVDEGTIAVTLTCGSELSIDSLAERLVEKARGAVGEKKVLLDSLGKFSKFLDVIMALSDGITDVHVGSKGAAVLACALFERCKTQQRCHEEAAKLMEDLSSFLPFTGDGFPGLMENERTKLVVKEMLELFCDISKLIIRYSSKGILGDLIFSRRDDIGKATDAFRKLKESFDWYVKAEQWRLAINTEKHAEDAQLQQLCAAKRAYYDIGKRCLGGTGVSVLEQIRVWGTSEAGPGLFWLHGMAGSGKSAIANSVAHMFEEQECLLGCFFYKKDDLECRLPMNVIPTLALHFAKWHESYRSMVVSIIQSRDGPKLMQSLQWQFELLMRNPLTSISVGREDLPPRPQVIVIDALDECGDSADLRSELAGFLVEVASVVPWLKVVITSRPLPEFQHAFHQTALSSKIFNLNTEVTPEQIEGDIVQYTRYCAERFRVNLEETHVMGLAAKASGLFIWTSTVFKFIGAQINKQRAVRTILSQGSMGSAEAELDKVYITVLQNAAGMGPDNTQIIRLIFCGPKAIYWLECLSIMEELKSGIDILELFTKQDEPVSVACRDLYRLLTANYTAVSFSTPHLYISALSWAPAKSYVAEALYPYFQNQPLIDTGKEMNWNPTLWTADAGGDVLECVAYSSDGRQIVSGSSDKVLRIWDAQTGSPVGESLTGHLDYINSVAYSPDGRHIVSGSDDWTLRIWDAQTRSPVGEPLTGHSYIVNSVSYSPDGRHIVSGSFDKTLRVWDAQTGSAVGEPLRGHSYWVNSVAYSPDGRHIVSCSFDKTLRVWDAQTRSAAGKPHRGHSDNVNSVAYSSDGRYIVSGSYDNTLRIWDPQTGNAVGKLLTSHSAGIRCFAYSPDRRHIVSGSGDWTLRIWDAQTRSPVGEPLTGHLDDINSVAYSPDGRHIVSGSDDWTLRIWDAQTRSPVGEPLTGHLDDINSVAYSPDGRYIVSGSDDKTLRIWDVQTRSAVGKPLIGHSGWVMSVAYSPDGRHIVSGSCDNTLRIWDATTVQAGFKVGGSHYPNRVNDNGWVRDPSGNLLLWVPHMYRVGIRDMSKICIPSLVDGQSVRVNWETLLEYSGPSWINILKQS